MAEIDKVTIEKRAKELAEQDGYTWEPAVTARGGPNALVKGQYVLSDENRAEYRSKARAELTKGSGTD